MASDSKPFKTPTARRGLVEKTGAVAGATAKIGLAVLLLTWLLNNRATDRLIRTIIDTFHLGWLEAEAGLQRVLQEMRPYLQPLAWLTVIGWLAGLIALIAGLYTVGFWVMLALVFAQLVAILVAKVIINSTLGALEWRNIGPGIAAILFQIMNVFTWPTLLLLGTQAYFAYIPGYILPSELVNPVFVWITLLGACLVLPMLVAGSVASLRAAWQNRLYRYSVYAVNLIMLLFCLTRLQAAAYHGKAGAGGYLAAVKVKSFLNNVWFLGGSEQSQAELNSQVRMGTISRAPIRRLVALDAPVLPTDDSRTMNDHLVWWSSPDSAIVLEHHQPVQVLLDQKHALEAGFGNSYVANPWAWAHAIARYRELVYAVRFDDPQYRDLQVWDLGWGDEWVFVPRTYVAVHAWPGQASGLTAATSKGDAEWVKMWTYPGTVITVPATAVEATIELETDSAGKVLDTVYTVEYGPSQRVLDVLNAPLGVGDRLQFWFNGEERIKAYVVNGIPLEQGTYVGFVTPEGFKPDPAMDNCWRKGAESGCMQREKRYRVQEDCNYFCGLWRPSTSRHWFCGPWRSTTEPTSPYVFQWSAPLKDPGSLQITCNVLNWRERRQFDTEGETFIDETKPSLHSGRWTISFRIKRSRVPVT